MKRTFEFCVLTLVQKSRKENEHIFRLVAHKERWLYHNGTKFFLLKPCQNKKDKYFVVMLGFFMSFFEFASAACCKKRHAKNQASQQTFGRSYFVRALS